MSKLRYIKDVYNMNILNPSRFKQESAIPRDGLLAEYLDVSGVDTSGNSRDLTVSGVTAATGHLGGVNSAYNFSAISDVMSDSVARSYNDNTTFSGWFRLTAEPSISFGRIFRLYSPSAGFVDFAYFSGFGGWYTSYSGGDGTNIYTQNTSFTVGTWYFFIIEVIGNVSYLYINNVLISSTVYQNPSVLPWNSTQMFLYLGNSNTINHALPKDMDDFRIYNRILTNEEKTILYNN